MAEDNQTPTASLDDPAEIFDLVNERDEVIGTVLRGQVHGNPRLIHRSVQVLVFDGRDRLFLQRRSRRKDLFPGYLCASAAGHVAAGEGYAATARREIREELDVDPPLRALGKVTVRSAPETEITTIYLARHDGPFHCHPTETDGGFFVTPAELADGLAAGSLRLTPAARAAIAQAVAAGAWPAAAQLPAESVSVLTT